MINSFDVVAVFGNKVKYCFDKVERCYDIATCCSNIVAGVDRALETCLCHLSLKVLF